MGGCVGFIYIYDYIVDTWSLYADLGARGHSNLSRVSDPLM